MTALWSQRRAGRSMIATAWLFLSLPALIASANAQQAAETTDADQASQSGVAGTGDEESLGSHANIVDLAICLASVIGCLIIIIPYIINRHNRKLRHSLILGLATSDLVSS